MKKWTLLLPVLAVAAAFVGCKEDVELNAPYRSDTVIYGILDPVQDTQWVRINRTWLGDGNNLDAATIRDSSEYADGTFNGTVNAWKSGNLQEAYTLESMTRQDKDDDGIFFGPEYTAYYFVAGEELDDESVYELQLEFPDKLVRAETNIIGTTPGSVTQPPQGIYYQMGFANVNGSLTLYNDFTAKWAPDDNASRYEVSFNIYVNEITYTDETWSTVESEKLKVLDWFIGTETGFSDNGNITREVNGEQFFRFLEARLEANPLIRREIGVWDEENQQVHAIDFVLTVANDELDTYIEVNSPVTGVIQERPQYSNVSNGIGIFASRRQIIVPNLGLSAGSYTALFDGEITAPLNFCSPNPFVDEYCGE